MQQAARAGGTVEESVGEAIARHRVRSGMTQRQFAAKLTSAGMPVDASAVSRIEKGTRSIRLTEAMTIANVLNVDLDFLVDGVRSPAEELKKIQRDTDMFLSDMSESFMLFTSGMLHAKWLLENNPELVEVLHDDEHGPPTAPGDYLQWCARRISGLGAMRIEDFEVDLGVLTRTKEEAEQLVDVVTAWASSRIRVDPELQGTGHGEHSEEA